MTAKGWRDPVFPLLPNFANRSHKAQDFYDFYIRGEVWSGRRESKRLALSTGKDKPNRRLRKSTVTSSGSLLGKYHDDQGQRNKLSLRKQRRDLYHSASYSRLHAPPLERSQDA